MNNSLSHTLDTLNGLLRVGLLDEAIDIGRRELRTQPRALPLQDTMGRILQAKLEQARLDELKNLHEMIRELNFPASHRVHAVFAVALRRAKGGTPFRDLIARAKIHLRHKESAAALDILREARSRHPGNLVVARLSAIAILHMLRRLRPRHEADAEQARPLLREYLREICPHIGMPSSLHSRLLAQLLRFGWDLEEPLQLLASLRSWPDVFWMPADTLTCEDFSTPPLIALFEVAMNQLTFEEMRLDMEGHIKNRVIVEEKERLVRRIQRTSEFVKEDHGSLPVLAWILIHMNQPEPAQPESLFPILRRYPKCIQGWMLLEHVAYGAGNIPLSIAAICQSLLHAPPGSEQLCRCHLRLAECLAETGSERAARLEFLLARASGPLPVRPGLPPEIPESPLEKQGYGDRPGEGNYDLYVREAARALEIIHGRGR